MANQFTQIMSERSDDQLIQIVTTDREKYNQSAMKAAEIEIAKRNIDPSVFSQKSEEYSFEKEKNEEVESNSASTGSRFLNYLIDVIAGYIFAIVAGIIISIIFPVDVFEYPMASTVFLVASFFAYYIMMEVVFQKTLGKFITKTKVVTIRGTKPKEQDIVLRTFCRLIPFDHLSFLFTKNGFHDHLSKTKVIKDN